MNKRILISGASFAGLATAYWMNKRGYEVTVVEVASGLKQGGTPVNIREHTVDIVKRMGLLDQIQANQIHMELTEFKNADDVTEKSEIREPLADDEYEIERDTLLHMMYDAVKDDVAFVFSDSIVSLEDNNDCVKVAFKSGQQRSYDLVFGCDGIHSIVRKLCFGKEEEFSHFLKTYFSITIVDKLLIRENTTQMYNEPGKTVMVNAYNGKTDIVLCFSSDHEIPYDYRNEQQQRDIILEQFTGMNWRVPELLEEVKNSLPFYFDKLCQMKMPSWTKGRVALVGDAGYCASPAAGMGGSLAIDGAAALADAFEQHHDDVELAFQTYNKSFRPFIEEVQADAAMMVEFLIPQTEDAIRERNAQ
ncbi:Salicylate 1-monooxygenase [Paenibacillus nuruki]|uniref:Salicylate 1-monooxygenase n=1 Tax=Paenibacillus nuruki TaxID=1886670 RepID=A0A1E3L8H1_9BACL|nr:FAD-dependent monooxygenase [Paenibacillus nuruki]ODP29485.1 Salicylate 1-monooxygenase [Paenibacillus nuruki]